MTGSFLSPNFSYDADGRMVADRSRSMQIRYDFRDRPLEFFHTEGAHRYKDVMRYDEAGNRISKLNFEGGLTDLDKLLADWEASHERDAASLAEAHLLLKQRVAGMTSAPGSANIHVVPDADGYVDLSGINELTAAPYMGGTTGYDISGIRAGTPEYDALLAERHMGFHLAKATHYTGLGNEIRETTGNTPGQLDIQVLTDLPNGLGRFEPNSNERLYYLKNHLGSTMVTALSNGTGYRDVYDYWPYGLQDRVAVSGGEKATPTFTGKELDESLGLYYFGARFLDPELAVWISPDPARQYNSSYTYCSENPLICSDKDGRAGGLQDLQNQMMAMMGIEKNEVMPAGPYQVTPYADVNITLGFKAQLGPLSLKVNGMSETDHYYPLKEPTYEQGGELGLKMGKFMLGVSATRRAESQGDVVKQPWAFKFMNKTKTWSSSGKNASVEVKNKNLDPDETKIGLGASSVIGGGEIGLKITPRSK
jgi:RHS repeat-associated protein